MGKRVKFILCYKDVQFSKTFTISEIPPDGRTVWFLAANDMEIATEVKHTNQHIASGEEYFEVFCDTSLENLLRLYDGVENMGWMIGCIDEFLARKDVQKAIKENRQQDADIARMKRKLSV